MAKLIEFNDVASAELERLTDKFGEDDEATLISRAIGLLTLVEDYMSDGAITVFDPYAKEGEEKFVRIRFEKAAKKKAA